jgi:hypothetical protein
VVVAVGLTLVEPLAADELNEPGAIEMVVAPLVAQCKVLVVPALTLVGFAANDEMEGMDDPEGGFEVVDALPHPANPAAIAKTARDAKAEQFHHASN